MSSLLHESLCKSRKQNTILGAFKRQAQLAKCDDVITVKELTMDRNQESIHDKSTSKTCSVSGTEELAENTDVLFDICTKTGKESETKVVSHKSAHERTKTQQSLVDGKDQTVAAIDLAFEIDHVIPRGCSKEHVKTTVVGETDIEQQDNKMYHSGAIAEERDGGEECLVKAAVLENSSVTGDISENAKEVITVSEEANETIEIEKANNVVVMMDCITAPLRKTRSGMAFNTPDRVPKKHKKGSSKKELNSYMCPICSRTVMCKGLREFNCHVDDCLNPGEGEEGHKQMSDSSAAEVVTDDKPESADSERQLGKENVIHISELVSVENSNKETVITCNKDNLTDISCKSKEVQSLDHQEQKQDSTFESRLSQKVTDNKVVDPKMGMGVSKMCYRPIGKKEKSLDSNSSKGYTENHNGAQVEIASELDSVLHKNKRSETEEYEVHSNGTECQALSHYTDNIHTVEIDLNKINGEHTEVCYKAYKDIVENKNSSDGFANSSGTVKTEEDSDVVTKECSTLPSDIDTKELPSELHVTDEDNQADVSVVTAGEECPSTSFKNLENIPELHDSHDNIFTAAEQSIPEWKKYTPEAVANLSGDEEKPVERAASLLVCPVCNIEQRLSSLAEFNQHVDSCLSRGAISEILREQRENGRPQAKR